MKVFILAVLIIAAYSYVYGNYGGYGGFPGFGYGYSGLTDFNRDGIPDQLEGGYFGGFGSSYGGYPGLYGGYPYNYGGFYGGYSPYLY